MRQPTQGLDGYEIAAPCPNHWRRELTSASEVIGHRTANPQILGGGFDTDERPICRQVHRTSPL